MQLDSPPAAMVDIDDAAAILGIPTHFARVYLNAHNEPSVAVYRGKPLWLSDTVHQILADSAIDLAAARWLVNP